MRVAVVQTHPIFGNIKQNVSDAVALMGEHHADLFVLPELFNTGYNFIDKKEVESLAEPISGFTFQTMSEFAKKKQCHIVYGFAEKADSTKPRTSNPEPQTRFYNSSALVGPTGLIGNYRKVHLYNRENLFFAPGDVGFPVFDTPFGNIGMMICFDWMYPESSRSLALNGAQLIAHPSNLVMPYCPDAMVTRCLENRVFAATADRVGEEDRGGLKFRYIGKSEIVTPTGAILQRLGENETGVAVAEVDLNLATNKQINQYNNLLNDRKVGQYSR